jgi:tRNA(Ile)-lysidine synthase
MAGAGGLNPAARRIRDLITEGIPDGPLVVALSGGADSAVCAWAVRHSGRTVRAVTVDHGLPASADLVAAAGAVAGSIGIDHVVVAVRSAGDEGARRVARYTAIESAAEPGELILTGHTADDQAETVLGNILRGAGAAGVAGIPADRGRWCRPMLRVTRDEVRDLAIELELPFADDPENEALDRRRSRLRVETIPYLEERFNPGLREALVRLGRFAVADEAALAGRVERVPLDTRGGVVRIPAAVLGTLPHAAAARLARRALRLVLDPYAGRSGDVESVVAVGTGSTTGAASLSEGLTAVREGPWVTLHGDPPPIPDPVGLPIPGEVRFGGWVLRTHQSDRVPVPRPLGRHIVMLDGAIGDLGVRAATEGDRIDLSKGSKPAFEALAEAGVPVRLRSVWPAVVSGGTMVWLVAARLAPRYRAADGPVVTVEAVEAT